MTGVRRVRLFPTRIYRRRLLMVHNGNDGANNGRTQFSLRFSLFLTKLPKKRNANVYLFSQSPESNRYGQNAVQTRSREMSRHQRYLSLREYDLKRKQWLSVHLARIAKYLIYRAKIEHIGRFKVREDPDRKIDKKYETIWNIGNSSK